MLKLNDIRKVHVELTTRCNARCPMCMRNYRGYDYNSGYPLCELSVGDFKKILTPDVLAQLIQPDPPIGDRVPIIYEFRGVAFNGNLGDFASAREKTDICVVITSIARIMLAILMKKTLFLLLLM